MSIVSKSIVYISLLVTIIHQISLLTDLFLHGLGDFERLCEDFPMVNGFFMVTYEFYNIVVHKKNIEALLYGIEHTRNRDQPTYAIKSYQPRQMGKIVNLLDKLGLVNMIVGFFVAELWVVRPLVTRSGKLPFGNPWYPFDIDKYYYYLWALHLFVGTAGCINSINIHLFYAKIMAVICDQFDILAHSFKNIDEDVHRLGTEEAEEEIFKRTRICIKYHQKILKCCSELQSCISGILVCQFCYGISLCFSALATFSVNSLNGAFINLLNHMLLELSELYIFCWFSNKLTEHAESVTDGIFYSHWYARSAKTKKLLQFVMMRCKKPMVIRAANILPVSIGSYLWIVHKSYSVFMVLRQVQSDD